jgi:uncharacterized protein YndB with AHSA1/START domain
VEKRRSTESQCITAFFYPLLGGGDKVALNTTAASDRELVITRVFDAPRELVFSAFTRPEHVTRWWGPNDFTLPFCEMDFRVGGSYKYCMRSPAGEDHWVWGEYREIAEAERIVFTWERKDLEGNPRSSSVVSLTFETFEEHEGKTKFTLRQGIFEFADDCAEHYEGWSQSLNRLEIYVERPAEN